MDTNDDFYGKELNLNCFYMHTNFEQKYSKTAIVIRVSQEFLAGFQKNVLGSYEFLALLEDKIRKSPFF